MFYLILFYFMVFITRKKGTQKLNITTQSWAQSATIRTARSDFLQPFLTYSTAIMNSISFCSDPPIWHVTAVHCSTWQITALHYSTWHATALHGTSHHCTTWHVTSLHYMTRHSTALQYMTRHITALHDTSQHCTAVHDTVHSLPFYRFIVRYFEYFSKFVFANFSNFFNTGWRIWEGSPPGAKASLRTFRAINSVCISTNSFSQKSVSSSSLIKLMVSIILDSSSSWGSTVTTR